jgi:hypothetical protein
MQSKKPSKDAWPMVCVPKQQGVWGWSICQHTTMQWCLSSCIYSSLKQTSLRSSWCGIIIIPMAVYQDNWRKVPFGGETLSGCWITSKGLPLFLWGMAQLSSSRRTFGEEWYPLKLILNCSHLLKTQISLSSTLLPRHTCHTWFSEENQMHLICALGSSLHTYDRRHEWNINNQQ